MRMSDWAPQVWHFLHAVTFAYADEPSADERRRVETFFRALPAVLPCHECGHHFARALDADGGARFAAALGGGAPLSRWLVDVHNDVNRRTGKPQVTYAAVRCLFDGNEGVRRSHACRCRRMQPQLVVVALVLVAFGVGGALGYVLAQRRAAPAR